MKYLIVNADDFGADEARNTGIFEAIAAGAVTSVSILPNGPALEDALRKIRSLDPGRISCGIHFNISEGKPISQGHQLLTGPDGYFLGKKPARDLLLHPGNSRLEEEIRKELSAQISVMEEAGVHPDHLDGHQHVHIFPAAIRPVLEEAKKSHIPWIRIPEEIDSIQDQSPKDGVPAEAHFFSGHAAAARPLLYELGFYTTGHFRGLYSKGRLPGSRWMEFLENMPHGLTEFMVHPGLAAGDSARGPFSAFSSRDREMELEALTDARFRLALQQTGVELTRFPEAAI